MLQFALAYCLVSFQAAVQGEEPKELENRPEIKTEFGGEGAQNDQIYGEYRGESCIDRAPEVCREFSSSLDKH